MLHITSAKERHFAYTVSGSLSVTELAIYYHQLDKQYRAHGKLFLEATVPSFSGFKTLGAWLTFLRHEPELLRKVATYTAYTDNLFVRIAVRILNALLGSIRLEAKPLAVRPQRETELTVKPAA